MPKYKYSRQELYEVLWKKSTTQLAKELDIKASKIRKICKHFSIPLPKSGYWSKLQFGKEVRIERMYDIKEYNTIKIDLREPFKNERDQYLSNLSMRIKEIESQFPKESKPSNKLFNLDPLIRETGDFLKSLKAQEYLYDGKIRPRDGYLYIEVSRPLIDRALRFCNNFILLCKLRGHNIIVRGRETVLIVQGEEYKIKIREKCNRVINTSGKYDRTDLIPNGKLSLKIDYFISKEWSDTKTKRLEDQLPKLVAAFELRAEKDIAVKKEWEIKRLEQERLRKIEANKQARIQWENKKIEILREHSRKWNESQNLSIFLLEVEKQENLSKVQKDWMVWAKRVVEYLNPLSKGIDDFIDKYDFKHAAKTNANYQ